MAVLKQWVEPKKLAAQAATLRGGVPSAMLPRLEGSVLAVGNIQAELVFASDHRRRPTATGQLIAEITCECQRCLEPVTLRLEPSVQWVAVRTEAELAELDASVEGWLAAEDEVDLYQMVEDELLLALPLVPKHVQACVDLSPPPNSEIQEDTVGSPFDVLKQMKPRPTR